MDNQVKPMKPISIVVLGAPGLGKSTLAGSVMELPGVEKGLLLVTKPGEEKSWKYTKHGLDAGAELYYDLGWNPTFGEYKAAAYMQLMRRLRDLQQDKTFDAVIIDPGTYAVNLIEHHILAPQNVGSPGELRDTQGFYRQLKDKAQEFVMYASLLSSSLVTQAGGKPKYVIIPWHTQPPKDTITVTENVGGQRTRKQVESADQKSAGIEYEGIVLPMIEGSYRRKLAADVDLVVYCDIEVSKQLDPKTKRMTEAVKYQIQVVPNKDRHSKIRIAPLLEGAMMPNSMLDLLKAVEEANQ